jgi:putative ABC transport system permease protein
MCDTRGTRWVEDLGQDIRFTARLLGRHRSFTFVAVMVLALGIGVNGLFLTLVDMICIRGLPLDRVDRVLYLTARDAGGRNLGVSPGEFDDLAIALRAQAHLAAFAAAPMAVGEEGHAPERFPGAYVSAGTFRVLRMAPVAGRDFRDEDDQPGAPAVVMLGGGVWRQRYQGDPSVIGRTIRVNGAPAVVIGVMPAAFKFPGNTEVWRPLGSMADAAPGARDARPLNVIGRLVDGVTREDVRRGAARA